MKYFAIFLLSIYTFNFSLAWSEGEDDPLWNKPTYEKKVYNVASRLLNRNNITEKIHFEVHRDSKEVNAAAHAGMNVIIVYSGLLNFIESDDELAALLSHEIAHITLNHGQKDNLKTAARLLLLGAPLAILGSMADQQSGAQVGATMGLALNQGFANADSRKDEAAADRIGFSYLVKAGYQPEAMLSLGTKIFNDGYINKLWRTHPMGTQRLEAIKTMIKNHQQEIALRKLEDPAEEAQTEHPPVPITNTVNSTETKETQNLLLIPDDDTSPVDQSGDVSKTPN